MSPPAELRRDLRRWLRLGTPETSVAFAVVHTESAGSYERSRILYEGRDGGSVPAFLLVPKELRGPAPAVVVHHQHNGERHLGKSEVCGLAGDPLQAFGAALAERGFVVLAPDSICFEDRRAGRSGTDSPMSSLALPGGGALEPHEDDAMQHYNAMCHRLVRGDTLMRTVLEDAESALSVLAGLATVDAQRIGVLGHSYGGNTTLFQAALDERARYACASGSACSYRDKIRSGTGIEMAEVLPGVLDRLDVEDLLRLAAPRPLLVVSASEDPYSRDADDLVRLAEPAYAESGASGRLEHARYGGGHALTRERFDLIVAWMTAAATAQVS